MEELDPCPLLDPLWAVRMPLLLMLCPCKHGQNYGNTMPTRPPSRAALMKGWGNDRLARGCYLYSALPRGHENNPAQWCLSFPWNVLQNLNSTIRVKMSKTEDLTRDYLKRTHDTITQMLNLFIQFTDFFPFHKIDEINGRNRKKGKEENPDFRKGWNGVCLFFLFR